jgi:hypothetical protein
MFAPGCLTTGSEDDVVASKCATPHLAWRLRLALIALLEPDRGTHMASQLATLAHWFAEHCDGEWEHHHGVRIRSTDNPGWWIEIGLTGTPLANAAFAAVEEGIGGDGHPAATRWLSCKIQDGVWHGIGDETRLEEIVSRFLDWTTKAYANPSP